MYNFKTSQETVFKTHNQIFSSSDICINYFNMLTFSFLIIIIIINIHTFIFFFLLIVVEMCSLYNFWITLDLYFNFVVWIFFECACSLILLLNRCEYKLFVLSVRFLLKKSMENDSCCIVMWQYQVSEILYIHVCVERWFESCPVPSFVATSGSLFCATCIDFHFDVWPWTHFKVIVHIAVGSVKLYSHTIWLTVSFDLFSRLKSLITFQLVPSLYDKKFTSLKVLRKNYNVSRAITLSMIIEHLKQNRSVFHWLRSHHTKISMQVEEAVLVETDWEQEFVAKCR
jgi:hypothetical protein